MELYVIFFIQPLLFQTYNMDAQIGESSACATALMCGVKTNFETVGLDVKGRFENCFSSFSSRIPSLIDWAQESGKFLLDNSVIYFENKKIACTYNTSTHCALLKNDISLLEGAKLFMYLHIHYIYLFLSSFIQSFVEELFLQTSLLQISFLGFLDFLCTYDLLVAFMVNRCTGISDCSFI